MLTAERTRALLHRVSTVIVDEVHALMRDKRGSHLALSLARLDAVAESRPQRIGLSATVHPIDDAARFLVGKGYPCAVVDVGHRRDLDLAIELPTTDLQAVATNEQWGEIYDRLAALVASHRTTLVFVNTRRMAERVAHHLGERLGEDRVGAHHGSLAKDRRLRTEQRLKAGEMRAHRRHGVAGAGHRRRIGRPGLPNRLAPRRHHVPAAHRALGARARAHVARTPVRHVARRAGRVRRAGPRRRRRDASIASSRPWPRSTCWPSRSWPSARRASGARTPCSPWCAGPRPTRTSRARTSTRSSRP